MAKKSDKILANFQLKAAKEASGKPTTASQSIKPALANAKIPKYIKKTLKFAKGVDGSDSPGRNEAGEQ